jgi:hypothetical protein
LKISRGRGVLNYMKEKKEKEGEGRSTKSNVSKVLYFIHKNDFDFTVL